MRYETPYPTMGQERVVKKFAWSRVKCSDGYTVYLGWYWEVYHYQRHNVRLPYFRGMKGVPPMIETIGYVLKEKLSTKP